MSFGWKNSLALLLLVWSLALPAGGAAADAAASWQRQLTPAAQRVLLAVQRLQEAGRERQALERLEKFRRQASRPYALVDFYAGNLYFACQRYREAVRVYRDLLRRQPDFSPARENLGAALLFLGENAAAAEVLVAAVAAAEKKKQPVSDRLLADAGIACLLAGRSREAATYLRRLVAGKSPPPEKYCRALVRACLELHDYAGAEAVILRQLDFNAADLALWRLLVQVRLAGGRKREALAAAKVTVNLAAPPTDNDLELLAGLYQEVGVPGPAAAALARLCRRQPRPAAARLDRVVDLFLLAGEADRALEWLDRKEQLYPSPRNRLRRGEILYRAGRYAAAYRVLSGLERLPGREGYQHLLAGYCAWYDGDLAAARESFARAAASEKYRRQAGSLLRTLDEILRQRQKTAGRRPRKTIVKKS